MTEAVEALVAGFVFDMEPGARVEIYFGTWCGNCAEEVPRFWRAFDENLGSVPFEVAYVGVARTRERPPELGGEIDIRAIPTVIVRRDCKEVGRIIEVAPNGIERDLLSLLTGEVTGVVTSLEGFGAPPG